MNFKRLFKDFIAGAADKGVLQMLCIFVLAGAFAGLARGIGSVQASVGAALSIIPGSMIYAGLFLTACIISFSVGTSVGTIVAVMPVAVGIASDTGISIPFIAGIVVGGAFFGDNLSFISDTTLAATKALGVKMRDKFKANFLVVLPAVLVTLAIYVIAGLSANIEVPAVTRPDAALLIPYILVIVLALCGLGVIKILCIGIVSCCLTGVLTGASSWLLLGGYAWEGVKSMRDVIIVAVLAGGILSMIKGLGWFDRFTEALRKVVHSRRGALASIAAIVSVTNVMTANNTVAIISVGGIASDIADNYGLNHRQTAGVLDMFSCLVQSLLPYGAQLLMASSFADISPMAIIPFLFYPVLMGICAEISIITTK